MSHEDSEQRFLWGHNIILNLKGLVFMLLVGIDVAKDKHDCFIQTSDNKVLYKSFTVANNYEGFEELYSKILSCNDDNVRVGLEATGHYSYNLLGFLLSKELATFVFNLFRPIKFVKVFLCAKPRLTKLMPRLSLLCSLQCLGIMFILCRSTEMKS